MFQLSFPFPSETAEDAANAASQASEEIGYYGKRSQKLANALTLIEKGEALLREARVEASKSECKGIDYRLRRLFIKLHGLKVAVVQKKRKLDMRIGVEE